LTEHWTQDKGNRRGH